MIQLNRYKLLCVLRASVRERCVGVIRVLLALLLVAGPLAAEDLFEHRALPTTGKEEAVLVLCPGMNGDGAFFLEETPWREFADRHALGLMAIHYTSPAGPMYSDARQGYYWPEQGSGEALLKEIQEVYGKDLPILIYGFSGGAHFVSRFSEWVPERVIAWSAYSAQFWDSPSESEILPPGIVACGEQDGVRWFPSFAYFYEGRRLGKPWTWVSLEGTGHVRNGDFEQFVREFFGEVLHGDESSSPVLVDVLSGETIDADEVLLQPGLAAILPSDALVESWRTLHAP
ncbi:hypothetical protein [Puniceicoccus vermicola]|uniref:Alpha/beta hydrolase n=1 Tax=Puniceicoccus vermicola TaxID=388746 RepID=A0A7X1E4H2_9BACT|nr:hypothetical protein [Puniceicoccus vermicola]MBC2601983.1 hypothetical protein [Puniceicoccus vermicola]